MARKKIGSKRTGRDSFVDDKTDAALSSVSEMSDVVRTKVMRPIGARPLPPPHLVRNADRDPYIYEGIPWINRGRGIIDPTPGNLNQPLNRRIRREYRSDLGTPSRISALRISPLQTMSYADGPMAAMADPRVIRNPQNVISVDDSRTAIQDVEAKVDAVLGSKPNTLREATDNLRKLENLVNAGTPNGRNFKLDIPYFEAQMQPELRAVSPRFSGENTPMSQYDYGVYYGLALNLLSYPRAFEHAHLILAANNNPDMPTEDGLGGKATSLPSYTLVSVKSDNQRQVQGVGIVTAESGAKDMSDVNIAVVGARVTSGARIPVVVSLPIYKSQDQKKGVMHLSNPMVQMIAQLTGNTIPPIEVLAATPEDNVEYYTDKLATAEKILAGSGVAGQPIMDGVSSGIIIGYLQQMEQVQARIDQLKSVTGGQGEDNALQMVRELENELSRLYAEAQKAGSLATTLHEMGHLLDYVSEYKTSSDYRSVVEQASQGLNSDIEYTRDVATLERVATGQNDPITKDLAEIMSRKFMKSKVVDVLMNEAILEAIGTLRQTTERTQNELGLIQQDISVFAPNGGGSQFDGWLDAFLMNEPQDINASSASSITRPIIASGKIPAALLQDPDRLSALAQGVIDKIKAIGEATIAEAGNPTLRQYYDFYNQEIRPRIDAANELIAKLPTPAGRAVALAATAIGINHSYLKTFSDAINVLAEKEEEAERDAVGYQYLVPWLSNQTIHSQSATEGYRNLLTDILGGNPAAVGEFMDLYGKTRTKPWFDQNGTFDPVAYLVDLFQDPANFKGVSLQTAIQMVNGWHRSRNSNGWKNLPDDDINAIRSAVGKLTEYAGPADYDFVMPLPKFEYATNKETYAELHPIILMRLESILKRLSEKERRAVEKLHDEMVAQAQTVIKRMDNGGQTP